MAQPSELWNAVRTELKKVNADVEHVDNHMYHVTFKEDIDYTVFVLRWS
jgi:predicted transport protein